MIVVFISLKKEDVKCLLISLVKDNITLSKLKNSSREIHLGFLAFLQEIRENYQFAL